MSFRIEKVGIIGAGTMGGGIAAHLANIGIPVVLLDIVPPNLSDAEKNDPKARNRFVQGGFQRMVKARPANLGRKDRADLITIGNTSDDIDLLADCDWVVEVIIEQLAPKQELMAKLEEVCKPTTIITSNTSGIPIGQIAQGRSDEFKARFLGTHFFNPPRYLKLLEIIPTPDTSKAVIDFMVDFGRKTLGKGVVVCKDTPNFIANRFIAVAGNYGVESALDLGMTVTEVDTITGPLIGRPKTATFRLTDLVGLDIMVHVNSNLYPAIPHDNYRELLVSPRVLAINDKMMENKWLGNKTGQGFYKKTMVKGKREFWTLNLETFEYEPSPKARFESVGAVRKIEDLGERLRQLFEHDDKAANYVRKNIYFNLAYAAAVGQEIANSITDIDNAVRWGFAHEAGPFEIWDMLGAAKTAENMEADGFVVADWVKDMLNAGITSFYNEEGQPYDFINGGRLKVERDPDYTSVSYLKKKNEGVLARNMSSSLHDMGDGVILYEFHAKLNAIDADMVEIGNKALEMLEEDQWRGIVMGNNGQDFCVGANIATVAMAAGQGLWDQVEKAIKDLQILAFNLRHAPKPVITAPHQRVLGGGVEMAMGGWESVADHETYMGLVEVGVGLMPAGGGLKELLRRKVNPVMRNPHGDVIPPMQQIFEQVATAKVGTTGAWAAKDLGYLNPDDTIVFNSDHRLMTAKRRVLQLAEAGARPPEIEKIYAAGRDVYAALQLGVQSFVWGHYASEHDKLIGKKIAYALTGGGISGPAWVDPWYILDLEREGFLSLLGEQKTIERIMHMLQTGKPLRN
ncbi:MAG: 3-hydroxyacyl-CoA dehydrogenase NAD-binding domain-containing protein [Ardenticatenaceae bacterium]|nr:3-hydroxyacyl-CoA dehydrogenase NAD-binding domain-containing protein [Ardenticatenaceae bacterium]